MSGQKTKAVTDELLKSNRNLHIPIREYLNIYTMQKYMLTEDTSLLNASSHWKQAHGFVLEEKTLNLSTRDVVEHRVSDDLILCRQLTWCETRCKREICLYMFKKAKMILCDCK